MWRLSGLLYNHICFQIAAMSDMEFDKFVKPLENSLTSKTRYFLLFALIIYLIIWYFIRYK